MLVGSDHYFLMWCPSVCPHKFQVTLVIATGETVDPAEWIIDDKHDLLIKTEHMPINHI